MTRSLSLHALDHVPLIEAGDDLAGIVMAGIKRDGLALEDGDILVLAQKIVSKAEGRLVDLKTVTPGPEALELAADTDKDPRLVELILSESRGIVRRVPGVLITEHRRGWIMANAGIDASNVGGEGEHVLLLPVDPDRSAADIRAAIAERLGIRAGVAISDSFGRPWRIGTAGVAIGAAGVPSLWDQRGQTDLFGRDLKVSQQAIADELAAAASLLQGQGGEGRPVVLVRGFAALPAASAPARPAAALLRAVEEDLFR